MKKPIEGNVIISLKEYHDFLKMQKVIEEGYSYVYHKDFYSEETLIKELNETEGMLMDTIRNLREELDNSKHTVFNRGKEAAVGRIKDMNWAEFKLLKAGIKKI